MLFSTVDQTKKDKFIDALLRKSKVGTWEYYPSEQKLFLRNEASLALVLGEKITAKEFPGKSILQTYFHEEDREAFKTALYKTLETGEPFEMDCRILKIDTEAEFRWLHIFGWRVEEEGQAFYLAGGMKDSHEKVTYQTNLQLMLEAEARAQILIDATPLCCNFWDEELNNIDCNEEALKLFGFPDRESYLGNFFNLWPRFQPNGRLSSEMFVEKLQKAFQTGYQRFEWLHQLLDGQPLPTEITLVRVKYGHSFIVAAYTHDLRELKATLAEIKNAQEELREARDLAERNANAKGEFLANMSHEIRTPMNAILGMLHLLAKTHVDYKQEYYLERASQSAKALLRIINDVLDFSKIEAGKLEMEQAEFSLESVLVNLTDVITEQIADDELELVLNIAPEVPYFFLGDSVRLGQVLLNLTSNAIKFTREGSVTIDISVREQSERAVELLFCVTDTGIGMSAEQTQHLFAPFLQADTSITRRYGGTGLGLAISKRLVNLMDGEIWCQSKPGQGTSFYFTAKFPLSQEKEQSAQNLEKMKILLLGDNFPDLAQLKFKLQILRADIDDRYLGKRIADLDFSQATFTGIEAVFLDFKDMQGALAKISSQLEKIELNLPLLVALLPQQKRPQNIDLHNIHFIYKPISLSYLYNAFTDACGYVNKVIPYCIEEDAVEEIVIPRILKGARILLAEDNEINQYLAVELLKNKGFDVTVANNGLEAVEKMAESRYDLILMDIQMPEMDGLTASKLIREQAHGKKIPILAMTANALTSDKELSLKAGMNDHLSKPIEPIILYKTIIYWLLRHRKVDI